MRVQTKASSLLQDETKKMTQIRIGEDTTKKDLALALGSGTGFGSCFGSGNGFGSWVRD